MLHENYQLIGNRVYEAGVIVNVQEDLVYAEIAGLTEEKEEIC